jgi:hypothetical protein
MLMLPVLLLRVFWLQCVWLCWQCGCCSALAHWRASGLVQVGHGSTIWIKIIWQLVVGAIERYNQMREVFCHAHLEEGQPAVKLILVELEIEHLDNGATSLDSLDNLFANNDASVNCSHKGIQGIHSWVAAGDGRSAGHPDLAPAGWPAPWSRQGFPPKTLSEILSC